jgi:predicted glycogen debranching enzyme
MESIERRSTTLTGTGGGPRDQAPGAMVETEWLVTNGIGGYASGTVWGSAARRYHGWLVAALPNPLGRVVMLSELTEQVTLPGGRTVDLSAEAPVEEHGDGDRIGSTTGFRLVRGLPVWRYDLVGVVVEKRVVLLHGQNTVHVTYALLEGADEVTLHVRPSLGFRRHETVVDGDVHATYSLHVWGGRYEIHGDPTFPPLKLTVWARDEAFVVQQREVGLVVYRMEESRGYQDRGGLWSPGCFRFRLHPGESATIAASSEDWEAVEALPPADAELAERTRRRRLLQAAPPLVREHAADLVLAADQFIITPAGRAEDRARAAAAGESAYTVIAGYHWFTDWGRDTMISLEGLCLLTGRLREAGSILRMFAHHVRDGLIPNLFPEGDSQGLYHTADATLWFFHAIGRYVEATGDRHTLRALLPTLVDIVERHVAGTAFGIGADPADGLLQAGAPGYQLTWMDAKVDDWVVTPRRGKPVEINALWYQALRLLEAWTREEGVPSGVDLGGLARTVHESFNRRFWHRDGRYLLDVVDGEDGDDPSFRPNQIFAVSLPHPVLRPERWRPVVEQVRDRLLTPVGLRTLAPGSLDYQPVYRGDLRERDAAYHQGTVWPWLMGPFVDAWTKTFPERTAEAAALLAPLRAHLQEACVGTVSEIFDAEEPHVPRGCVAQAWSVAELLRATVAIHRAVDGLSNNGNGGRRLTS